MNLFTVMERIEAVAVARRQRLTLRIECDLSGTVVDFLDDSEVCEFDNPSELAQWLDKQPNGALATVGTAQQEKPRCNHKH